MLPELLVLSYRSPLTAPDYVFLGGCFAAATLVWWLLVALSRR